PRAPDTAAPPARTSPASAAAPISPAPPPAAQQPARPAWNSQTPAAADRVSGSPPRPASPHSPTAPSQPDHPSLPPACPGHQAHRIACAGRFFRAAQAIAGRAGRLGGGCPPKGAQDDDGGRRYEGGRKPGDVGAGF